MSWAKGPQLPERDDQGTPQPPPGRGGSRLPLILLFVVVDAILVVAVLVFFLGR